MGLWAQREGFILKNSEHLVWSLNKGLYGLRQGARYWNIEFDLFLQKFDLIPSEADSCVYHDKNMDTILVIFIDDGLACSNNQD